uniref:PDZ domain-containing protein n=1 Tax=Alexandrium andersonii TaxID=327968 RepID=A0A7S2G2X0_9DINO
MGAHGSCCSCEDETSTSYVEDGKRPRRESRKRSPNEFTIIIDRRTGEGLGIDASPEKNGTLEIKNITPSGLVDRWNQSLPDDSREHVRPGMRVIEVNGRYNSAMQLIAACRETEVLHITLALPEH